MKNFIKKNMKILVVFMTLLLATSVYSTNYTLIFGVNYKGSPVPDLDLCESDAKLIKTSLLKNGIFKSKTMRIFLGKHVTRNNLYKNIVGWLSKVAKPKDQVFFFFAGHGTFQRDADSKNGMKNFMVMYNRPHVSDDELSKWFKKIKAPKSMIVLDACFSGGVAKKGRKTRGSGNIPIPKGQESVVIQDNEDVFFQNKTVIGSADDNETAIEIGGNINHGVFTYYFAKALSSADLNNDKIVTAYEAFFKARNNTTKFAKRFHHNQHPQISGNASGFILKKSKNVVIKPPVKKPDVKKDPVKPVNPKKEIVKPVKPDDPKPPIDEKEPKNVKNKAKGHLAIETTYRYKILKWNKPKVYVDGKQVKYRIRYRRSENWGRIAKLYVRNIPTGVHNVSIDAKKYPMQYLKTGIEKGKTTHEKIVVSRKGRGGIQGHVWAGNFETPFKKVMLMLEPLSIHNAKAHTKKDGSFAFYNLKPGKYNIIIVGGLGHHVKPYNAEIVIKADKVSKIEIVMKVTFDAKKQKKDEMKRIRGGLQFNQKIDMKDFK